MRGLPYRYTVAEQIESRLEVIEPGTNMLALLFRRIRNDMGIKPRIWSTMMHKYLRDARNDIGTSSTSRTSESSNLNRGLAKPHMTFMVFMKGLRVINPNELKFHIELELSDDVTISESLTMTQDELYMDYSNERHPDRLNVLNNMLRWILVSQGLGYVDIETNQIQLTEAGKDALNDYLTTRRPDLTNSKITTERSYLTSAISKPVISIKVFSKMMQVVNPYRMKFGVTMMFGNTSTNHMVVVEGSSIDPGDKDESE